MNDMSYAFHGPRGTQVKKGPDGSYRYRKISRFRRRFGLYTADCFNILWHQTSTLSYYSLLVTQVDS